MGDDFLQDWLGAANNSARLFKQANLTGDALNEQAIAHGYRTGRVWKQAMQDHQSALHHFVNADAFGKLWECAKNHDAIYGEGCAYSPAIRGIPNRLLEALDAWHRLPKFTKTERAAHSKKIAKACEQLQDLLGQLLPADAFKAPYSRFILGRDGQADAVFRVFKSEPLNKPSVIFEAGHNLKQCGVTPLWAVGNIRQMAEAEAAVIRSKFVPTKIRADTAKKTYLIGAFSRAINTACMDALPSQLGITHEQIADVVALLAGTECQVEDVRKRLAELEDSQ